MKYLWFLVVVAGCGRLAPSLNPPPVLPVLTDGATVRVAVDPQRGGGIPLLEIVNGGASSGNIVDDGDQTGRGIQLALYSGASLPLPNASFDPNAWPCNNSSALWGHDPVLMGNACQQVSGGVVVDQIADRITVTTTPLEWNSLRGRSHVQVVSDVQLLAPGVVKLTYTITNHEAFAFDAPNVQEAPCVYLEPRFTVRTSGVGWIALSDAAGWTVALVAPHAQLLTFNTGGGGPHPTSLMQAWQPITLAQEATGVLSAVLVVGSTLDQVRQRIAGL